ncbi:hypothetical protein [Aureimonas psammosilenae]|uniref:hypothetical protein n=1 Tax=Aureimonas psammosilenae TaxID=2495496 RepID=UPI001260E1F0|nr:hypothetical protein [Aureimonas psammosilenae]
MTSPWWTTLLSDFVALTVAWATVHLDRRKAVNQELMKKRIAIYDAIVPKVHDLLCCFTCVEAGATFR